MKENPFPGMNPWLEAHWGDVHTRLTMYACDQLQPDLPPGLRARVEEYVAVEAADESDDARSLFAPDVRVLERPDAPEEPAQAATALATLDEPLVVPLRREPETLRYLRIVDHADGDRVVTAIEFLSLANKLGAEGRRQYRAKQRKMLAGRVNLVEIDLLRAGAWVLAAQQDLVPRACRGPYRICVVRARRDGTAEVYRVPLCHPLPSIRIPLRPNDDDVPLRLQTLIDTAYVNGRYAEDIDYAAEPLPPLAPADAEWAAQVLRDKSLK